MWLILGLIVVALLISVSIYAVYLAATDDFVDNNMRILWIVGIIFCVPIMGITYVLMRKRLGFG